MTPAGSGHVLMPFDDQRRDPPGQRRGVLFDEIGLRSFDVTNESATLESLVFTSSESVTPGTVKQRPFARARRPARKLLPSWRLYRVAAVGDGRMNDLEVRTVAIAVVAKQRSPGQDALR